MHSILLLTQCSPDGSVASIYLFLQAESSENIFSRHLDKVCDLTFKISNIYLYIQDCYLKSNTLNGNLVTTNITMIGSAVQCMVHRFYPSNPYLILKACWLLYMLRCFSTTSISNQGTASISNQMKLSPQATIEFCSDPFPT